MHKRLSALVGSLFLAACGSGEPEPTYQRDVAPLVQTFCADCHTAGGIAPFALDSYDSLRAALGPSQHAINLRSMPPWGAEAGHQLYKYDISLSDEQISLFNRWVELGTPLGEGDKAAIYEIDKGGFAKADVSLKMAESYTPDTNKPDDYRCFNIDWPVQEDVYVNGFRGVPGNQASVHHIVAFLVGPHQAAVIDQFDQEAEGPGYGCYGGATADGWKPATPADTLRYSFLGQWAPGQLGSTYPEGTGLLVKPGSKVVFQVHYNTLAEGDLTDRSSIELSYVKEARESYYVPWFNMQWYLDSKSMRIEKGQTDVKHSFSSPLEDAPALAALTGGADFSRGAKISALFPHMHQLGKTISLRMVRGDLSTTLLSLPRWDFDWQREYHLEKPVILNPRDHLEISCTYDNTRGHRMKQAISPAEPVEVGWGEGTGDEMCIAMIYVTPL